jgi:hypothetical protein
MESSMEVPQKTKSGTIWYNYTTPVCIPEGNKVRISRDSCTSGFIAAQFTIAKQRHELRCLLTDECIKMWYVCTRALIQPRWDRVTLFPGKRQNWRLSHWVKWAGPRKTSSACFLPGVEPKSDLKIEEGCLGTGLGEGKKEGEERVGGRVEMVKEPHVHGWKCHSEAR